MNGVKPGRSGNVFLLPDEKEQKPRTPRHCLIAHQPNRALEGTRVVHRLFPASAVRRAPQFGR